jgi:hypothetical protein
MCSHTEIQLRLTKIEQYYMRQMIDFLLLLCHGRKREINDQLINGESPGVFKVTGDAISNNGGGLRWCGSINMAHNLDRRE